MNPLKSLETTIASLVEGGFGRLFRSEVRPMELARKLAREMDEHRTASVSRVYAPNEYSVWLSPQDRARYDGVEHEVIDELCAYLLEHARREELILASPPSIGFHTDEELALGEFGIQARLVRPPSRVRSQPRAAAASPLDAQRRRTRADDDLQHLGAHRGSRSRKPTTRRAARALLAVGGRRLIVPPGGGMIGRSRECDIVLDDAGVSRRHAEIRPDAAGWALRGPRLDQRRARQRPRDPRRAAAAPGRPRRDRLDRDRLRTRMTTLAARIGGAEVRLSRRALPVPAVGRAQRAADLRGAARGRRGRRFRSRRGDPGRCDRAVLGLDARQRRRRPPRPRLVVERAPGHDPGMIYDLDGDIVLGRGERAEIRLEDPFASSRHARVYEQGNIVVIEDLGSTNGTYLNEELLETPRPLHPGDRVRIGDSEFTFEVD